MKTNELAYADVIAAKLQCLTIVLLNFSAWSLRWDRNEAKYKIDNTRVECKTKQTQ